MLDLECSIISNYEMTKDYFIIFNFDKTVKGDIVKWFLDKSTNDNTMRFKFENLKRRNFYIYKEKGNFMVYLMLWIFEKNVKLGLVPRKIYQKRILIDKYKKKISFKVDNIGSFTLEWNIRNKSFKIGKKSIFENKNYLLYIAPKIVSNEKYRFYHKLGSPKFLYEAVDFINKNRGTPLLSSLLIDEDQIDNIEDLKQGFIRTVDYLIEFYKDINIKFDKTINWVDVITYLATRIYNYISDEGNGDYIPVDGDCEDLVLITMHNLSIFRKIKFNKNGLEPEKLCHDLQTECNKYHVGFSLTSSRSYKFGGTGGIEEGFHVLLTAMRKKNNENENENLIVEPTNIVYPKNIQYPKKSNGLNYRFKDALLAGDQGIRTLNFFVDSDFYNKLYQIFIPDKIKRRYYGYNLYYKNDYGVKMKKFFKCKYSTDKIEVDDELLKLSYFDSRFKFPFLYSRKLCYINKHLEDKDFEVDISKYKYKKLENESPSFVGWFSKNDLKLKKIIKNLDKISKKNHINIEKQIIMEHDEYYSYYIQIFDKIN
jgi:hypothetical protein